MWLEIALGKLMAAAGLCFFAWLALRMLSREGVIELRDEIREDPISVVTTVVMMGGLLLFLYWLIAGNTAIGIDHLRPYGWPLGLWGFGVAMAALVVQWNFGKR